MPHPFPAERPSPAPARLRGLAAGATGHVSTKVAGFLLALSLALPAGAGMVITGDHKTLDGSQPAFTYTLSLDKGKVRMTTSNAPDNVYIYRADKGLFWLIDNKQKTYSEMTRKDLEAMANTMNEAMRKMKEQLANLPPEQREMMEKMMPQGAGDAKITFKKLGGGKAGPYACEKYEMLRDGAKAAEGCNADPKALGFADDEFKTLLDLSKPFEKIAKDFAAMLPQNAPGAPQGIPVRTVFYEGGKAHAEATIKGAKKEALSAELFEVPKGLAKQAMGAPKG